MAATPLGAATFKASGSFRVRLAQRRRGVGREEAAGLIADSLAVRGLCPRERWPGYLHVAVGVVATIAAGLAGRVLVIGTVRLSGVGAEVFRVRRRKARLISMAHRVRQGLRRDKHRDQNRQNGAEEGADNPNHDRELSHTPDAVKLIRGRGLMIV